ncbi:MAG: orotidine-5'-phosphate decarboxylase [Cytophagaceae bacterium]|jgi:orotidine-5'-phosphate decarboxylase|nr:orotidine-5'-phosphate decarboxylase [Cytophagaceae bacterium]
MTRQELAEQIFKKGSFLCVGLDTDIEKLPACVKSEKDPVFEFNKRIIDATLPYAVAYKPNLAFYEAMGPAGWESLQKTMEYLPKDVFTIADAKRGDIGNTSGLYARAFFRYFNFDSVTVAPYMGSDSVKPFLAFENKWVILLALTSNAGAFDFQTQELHNGKTLYQQVMETSTQWGTAENLMFVLGATKTEYLAAIRKEYPDYFFLVPGVGAQGGDLAAVAQAALNKQGGLLVNSSRNILYAGNGDDFDQKAAKEAAKLALEMKELLTLYSA